MRRTYGDRRTRTRVHDGEALARPVVDGSQGPSPTCRRGSGTGPARGQRTDRPAARAWRCGTTTGGTGPTRDRRGSSARPTPARHGSDAGLAQARRRPGTRATNWSSNCARVAARDHHGRHWSNAGPTHARRKPAAGPAQGQRTGCARVAARDHHGRHWSDAEPARVRRTPAARPARVRRTPAARPARVRRTSGASPARVRRKPAARPARIQRTPGAGPAAGFVRLRACGREGLPGYGLESPSVLAVRPQPAAFFLAPPIPPLATRLTPTNPAAAQNAACAAGSEASGPPGPAVSR